MKKSNKGFTLVELIIVIAILAIIMLIAIPNFSGIQQRMKVRADKATAAQIGKAVRVWYTDYTSDPTLNANLKIKDTDAVTEPDKIFVNATNCAYYTGLTGISAYASKYTPTSLLTGANGTAEPYQFYLVGLTSNTTAGKVCVAIAKGDAQDTPTAVAVSADANYDGTAPAIAYVEP